MKLHHKKKKIIPILALIMNLIFCILVLGAGSSIASSGVSRLDATKIQSVSEMNSAIELIVKNHHPSAGSAQASFESQKILLNKTGECISRLVTLHAKAAPVSKQLKEKEKRIFFVIRDFLKQTLSENEKIIWDIQEHTLDKLEDPSPFIKSAKWQNPQYLISLSSYWTGWNGYYASTLVSDDDPVQTELLNEAVKGFSRSFVDFQEEAVIVRSLFGRALCYGRLKEYESARQDLITVKKKLNKDDPLYIRCLFEEVRMVYQTGNYEIALRALEEINEDFPRKNIPDEIVAGLDSLKSKVLVALLEKQGPSGTKTDNAPGTGQNRNMFQKLRRLADNPSGAAELYRYVQENADELKKKPYRDLGPVAALALGDMAFDKKEYDVALSYYQPLYGDFPSFIADRKDGVGFRMAYIYCKKEDYERAIGILDRFHKEFPDSFYIKQSVPLYYVAATRNYNKVGSKQAYDTLIDAISLYVKRCSGNCPEMSEAHWKLGKHYQKTGKAKPAATEFLRVNTDSPNYFTAKYYVLQQYVDELEAMEKMGQYPSNAATRIYENGSSLIREFHKNSANRRKGAGNLDVLEAPMIILESDLRLYGPTGNLAQNLKNLKGFEQRFPQEKKMFLKAFQLRMVGYQRLGLIEDARKEIGRFITSPAFGSEGFTVLNNLANRFYQEAERRWKGGEKADANQYWDIALVLFDQLHEVSCKDPKQQKFCDRSQLNMAQIYINRNQLDKAEDLYINILKKNSLSADAVYNLGLLYEKQEKWRESLDTWRKFSDGVKTGTYHWFESRYRTAVSLTKLGDDKKACEILTITMILHPDLGSEELTQKFTALKAEICPKES